MAFAIQFFNEQVKFRPRSVTKLKSWIKKAILAENKEPGQVNYIFCSDSFLVDMNQEYLQHDTLTDIITFNTSERGNLIEGDIFISIERIQDNARRFNTSFDSELHRVMIHGILHLIGYGDKTIPEKRTMRKKEDAYLSLRDFSN